MLTLDQLPSGEDATVLEVTEPTGAEAFATSLRLREMGLVPTTLVRVLRRAPWGDPIEVEVRGTRVVLRRADARRFRVARAAP